MPAPAVPAVAAQTTSAFPAVSWASAALYCDEGVNRLAWMSAKGSGGAAAGPAARVGTAVACCRSRLDSVDVAEQRDRPGGGEGDLDRRSTVSERADHAVASCHAEIVAAVIVDVADQRSIARPAEHQPRLG